MQHFGRFPGGDAPRPTPSVDPVRLRQRMVQRLEARGITSRAVLKAMAAVPRDLFVQEALRARAYEDAALPIGFGQTISQPYTVAFMSQMLEAGPGLRVLEVGTGSGYQTAILATMGCAVFTVERRRDLYQNAAALLRSLGLRSIHMVCGDGTLGMPEAAPFDRIIVTAGGPEMPRPLAAQLDMGGLMVIPLGRRPQRLMRYRRHEGGIAGEDLGPTEFVDLVGDHGW